jgi:hypothetical protein
MEPPERLELAEVAGPAVVHASTSAAAIALVTRACTDRSSGRAHARVKRDSLLAMGVRAGAIAVALVLVACGTKGETASGEATGSSGAAESSGGSDSGTTLVADTSSSEASSTGAALVDVPAAGIAIDFVEINQGVSVRIGEHGEGVGPTDRTAPVVANRLALVRAFYTLPSDWQPRDIEARLVLQHPDGSTETVLDHKVIAEDAFAGDLTRTFYWGVEAEKMQQGLGYRVELWDADPGEPIDAEPPQLPADGSFAPVGVEGSDLLLKALIVPIEYDDGMACQTSPDISDETMQLYQDLMFMMNPLDALDVQIREPVQWTTPLTSFSELNVMLSDLRFSDGAPPELYYYGIIDPCAYDVDGFGGMAYDIPTDPTAMDAAYMRAASGLALSDDPDFSAETFVHEVGHLQGRRHVACNGEEAGPDPSYPIPGGAVGEWGFGVIDFQLRHPTVHKDYMTYCHPVWVSTFGWNKVYPVITALSMWDAPLPPTKARVLAGVLLPDGRELWHVVPGATPRDREPETQLELTIAGTTTRVPAWLAEVPDAPGHFTIAAALPVPLGSIDALARLHRGAKLPIDRAAIRVATIR